MANYTWKNRHGRYYFRARIPARFRSAFNGRSELRIPLNTSERRHAKQLARIRMVAFEQTLNGLEQMKTKKKHDDSLSLGLTLTVSPLENGGAQTSIDFTEEELDSFSPEHVSSITNTVMKHSMQAVRVPDRATTSQITHEAPTLDSPTIKEAVTEYLDARKQEIAKKTLEKHASTLRMLEEYFGNRKIVSIKRSEAHRFIEDLAKLPINIYAVNSPYKGKDLKEVLRTHDGKRISTKTRKDHLINLRAFFKWQLFRCDALNTNPFDGLTVKTEDRGRKRKGYTDAQLLKIFSSYLYNQSPWPKNKVGTEPSKFWVLLILAYTGCRLNEACQLYVDDIYKDIDGIDIIDLKAERSDQSIKGKLPRKVPVHRVLKNAGLLKFVESQKKSGQQRLFPELKYSSNGDGYGRTIGEFLRKLIKDVTGISDGTLHAFRHTVVEKLTQNDVPKGQIQSIVGHRGQDDVTTKSYGGGEFTNKQKKHALSKLKSPVDDLPISYSEFLKRTRGRV